MRFRDLPIVNYYTKEGALHTGYNAGIVKKGARKGRIKIYDAVGKIIFIDRSQIK